MQTKSTEDIYKIIEENNARKADYFRWYNPVIGDPKSEVVPRFELLVDGVTYYVPESMREDQFVKVLQKYKGDIYKIAEQANISEPQDILNTFFQIRLDYDVEFYFYTCSFIEDKATADTINFFLNKGQRVLLKEIESQRLDRLPIRAVLVKARQFGGSTLIVRYIQWLQLHVRKSWHSAIISAVQDQSLNLRADYEMGINNLPAFHPKITIKGMGASASSKYIPQRHCKIKISSAERPNNLRSFSLKAIHMTECGNWPNTATKSGNEIAQSAYNTVPDEPDTFIALESTALGVGNFFHKQYQIAKMNARDGRKGLRPVFVGFFMIDRYNLPIKNMEAFIKSMTQYNWWQWKQGATLESINWYREYKAANQFTDFQMKSEFPTTADEAFQSNSGRYFNDTTIAYLRRGCSTPSFIGDIRGDGLKGPAALDGITLVPNDSLRTEVLKIWIHPDDFINPKVQKVTNRFIVVVDIGGTHYKSDYSIISVFDRLGLSQDKGAMERAALWRGHIDHDLLAWKAVQLAKIYHNALLVIESNTIDSRDKKSGEGFASNGLHFYTVLNEIQEYYPNLYMREAPADKLGATPTMKIGWHMNKVTKYQAYDRYTYVCRERQFIEHDDYAVDEACFLEVKRDGTIGNVDGEHDDIQDTCAIGAYIGTNFAQMPMPRVVDLTAEREGTPRMRGGSMATF